MKTDAEKAREQRLRREAAKFGLVVQKSRYRNPDRIGFGGYMILDPSANNVVAGGYPFVYGFDLDDVEDYLTADE